MKRLTERDEFGNADIIALSDVMPELYAELSFSETNALTDALNKLAEFEDAEEKGLLFQLPDIPQNAEMYAVLKSNSGKYHIRKLKLIMWEIRRGVLLGHLYDGNWNLSYYPSDDDTERQYIYRTKAEAQQALKARENNEN